MLGETEMQCFKKKHLHLAVATLKLWKWYALSERKHEKKNTLTNLEKVIFCKEVPGGHKVLLFRIKGFVCIRQLGGTNIKLWLTPTTLHYLYHMTDYWDLLSCIVLVLVLPALGIQQLHKQNHPS